MTQHSEPIIGIDLGTTNSVVAAYVNGKVQVLSDGSDGILPSVVGVTTDDKLIVGRTARNQLIAFPERTVASVKRQMGTTKILTMAGQDYTPQEISALILKQLRQRAEKALGCEVTRAVITVPAFFDENQRQATREAGTLAGLTVERIINEPTAASLVYHAGQDDRRHLIVYDLGGGTFDVSIVRIEGGVIEVLSSMGDTQLGGDDFDQLLTSHVAKEFRDRHGIDPMEHPVTRWRLLQACERAKCELSFSTHARITEEFIATVDGMPVNLDIEIDRNEYEDLIRPLVDRTIQCVDQAIQESRLNLQQLDELILVGGSTRTPLVQERLRTEFHREPHWSVNPDFAVALGAATQAAIHQGHPVGPVLIDVATHTVGIETLDVSSYSMKMLYSPLIRRNTPLPAKHEQAFSTITPDQEEVHINVFQGESDELSRNRKIGEFRLEGLNQTDDADGEIDVCFELTLDGVLRVSAKEHKSGIATSIVIANSMSDARQSTHELTDARLRDLFATSDSESDSGESLPLDHPDSHQPLPAIELHGPHTSPPEPVVSDAGRELKSWQRLTAKAITVANGLDTDDAQDIRRLVQLIESADRDNDEELVRDLEEELDDLLFYVTG
ncbi:MAG: Hsp70 family protein [Pirellulaceae bacterium]|nr:Hsp70 family protein [Planctomycetales bacterium]